MPDPEATVRRLRSASVLTFDCYGTLIDWESGLLGAMRRVLERHGDHAADDDELLEAYARAEARLEAGPYLPYREVLRRCLVEVGATRGVQPRADEQARFAESVGDWPAFADSPEALQRLKERFRLGVITNCDDDLFEHSRRRLAVEFDWIVTAERAGAYKPDPRPFEIALVEIGLAREAVVHVAQSLHHDHVPAKRLGLATVWVDRRHDRPGFGATPPARAEPDLVVPDLARLADLAA